MALELGTNSFITVADANAYYRDSLRFDDWDALSGSKKIRALITAAQQINLILKEDCQFTNSDIDTNLALANAELALDMATDSKLVTSGGTSKNTKRVKAGSAEVEFFRPENGSRFPPMVMNLLKASGCLSTSAGVGVAGVGGAMATGTCDDSYFVNNSLSKTDGYA